MTPLDEAIIANDLLPREQQRTNQEIADEFSTSEASVRRHRAKLKRRGAPDQGHDAFFNDVPVDVGGTAVGFTHGHLAGRQSKVGDWFRGQAFGRRSGLERAHVLVHGHWHNFGVSQVGDGRWVISCPSADRGSDWWTNISGDSTASSVLSFEVKGGDALAWRLW